MPNKKTWRRTADVTTKSEKVNGDAHVTQLLDDDYLRGALADLSTRADWPGTKQWEAIGAQLLILAKRDSRSWRSHAGEYRSAYLAGAVEFLRRHPELVMSANRPWALLVARGKLCGKTAVGVETGIGLTWRDPITHHLRVADLPTVVSLDQIADQIDDRPQPSYGW